jgi:hypothetical protein
MKLVSLVTAAAIAFCYLATPSGVVVLPAKVEIGYHTATVPVPVVDYIRFGLKYRWWI